MKIQIKSLTGTKIALDVSDDDTILTVKSKIHSKTGDPPDRIRLIFKDVKLDNNRLVSDYDILPNDILYKTLELGPQEVKNDRNKFQFEVVIHESGSRIQLETESSELLVSQLKQKIFQAKGIEPNVQRIIFKGKELDDHATLSDYSISQNSKIFLILHQPPGVMTMYVLYSMFLIIIYT